MLKYLQHMPLKMAVKEWHSYILRFQFSPQDFQSSPLVCGLFLHSINGAAMKAQTTKAQTTKAKLEPLGVRSSYSRPRVSKDNPYSELLFRTLRYRPEWPSSGFVSFGPARDWVQNVVGWYNEIISTAKLILLLSAMPVKATRDYRNEQ
jgi:hypothetical protein